ncbi:MAG: Txe/YoeB family addiction module toxin [Bacteroidaceae bacterium]|nr:Txe/YoeB family addiction module toxin [Bacteroidaceae bacterium]
MYTIRYMPKAEGDLQKLKRSEPKAFLKVVKLLNELAVHPKTGTGHPEQLKGDRVGQWSRQITKKHRLIYTINDDTVIVLVLTAYGHYNDK